MKINLHRGGRALGLGCLLGVFVASAGCGGEDPLVCQPAQASAQPILVPSTIHTGFNGRDTFQVPIITNFSPDGWESENPAVATVVPVVDCKASNLLEVTALLDGTGAGTTRINAVAGANRFPIDVEVAQYTTEQIDLGNQRYHTPANASTARMACVGCHTGAEGVDHSPLVLAGYSDEVILEVVKNGTYPDCVAISGDPCQCGTEGCRRIAVPEVIIPDTNTFVPPGTPHVWEFTAEEETAIVAYLRSLQPRGIPGVSDGTEAQ